MNTLVTSEDTVYFKTTPKKERALLQARYIRRRHFKIYLTMLSMD
jgi:hypothetical protein